MELKNKELDELIYQFFDKNEHVENCILINADEQSVLILGREAEGLYLKKDLSHNGVMVREEILNGLNSKFDSKKVDDVCEALLDEDSEINKALRRYIVSDGLMEAFPSQWEQIVASCSEIESCFSKCKDGIYHLLKEINTVCEDSEFDDDNRFWVVAGKTTNSFLIRYYYSQNISFDPIIADSRLVFFPDGFSKSEYAVKKEKMEKAEESLSTKPEVREKEHKSEVFISLYGENEMSTISLNISEDEKTVIEYIGPIFVADDDKFEVQLEDFVKKISLPYSVLPLDCDLVDIAAIKKENQLYLRIRRTQYPTRLFDVLIERDTL